MERLSKRDANGKVIQMTTSSTGRKFHADEVWQKLAAYEELEEQGKLIKLPCAVGGTVWFVRGDVVHRCEIRSIELTDFPNRETARHNATLYSYRDCKKRKVIWLSDKLGKTVFLTESEAQQALEKNSGGKNDG